MHAVNERWKRLSQLSLRFGILSFTAKNRNSMNNKRATYTYIWSSFWNCEQNNFTKPFYSFLVFQKHMFFDALREANVGEGLYVKWNVYSTVEVYAIGPFFLNCAYLYLCIEFTVCSYSCICKMSLPNSWISCTFIFRFFVSWYLVIINEMTKKYKTCQYLCHFLHSKK